MLGDALRVVIDEDRSPKKAAETWRRNGQDWLLGIRRAMKSFKRELTVTIITWTD
jgi:hypothetical protein